MKSILLTNHFALEAPVGSGKTLITFANSTVPMELRAKVIPLVVAITYIPFQIFVSISST
jgi:hypothetical protein